MLGIMPGLCGTIIMKIAVERVRNIREAVGRINAIPLREIEPTLDGEVIPIPPERLVEWEFTGLDNMKFFEILVEEIVEFGNDQKAQDTTGVEEGE